MLLENASIYARIGYAQNKIEKREGIFILIIQQYLQSFDHLMNRPFTGCPFGDAALSIFDSIYFLDPSVLR